LGISTELRYLSVDDLVKVVRDLGRGCLIYKIDLKAAFRQLPVDPGDIHCLGFTWDGHIYIDGVMAMGLRSAAYCCQRLTNSLAYIHGTKGYHLVNYLDDMAGGEVVHKAEAAFLSLRHLLQQLGIFESTDKACPPSTSMVFLGILLDTNHFTITVPEGKLQETLRELHEWDNRDRAKVKQVQSIVGKLNFVGKCVPASRIFIARMLNFLREMNRSGYTSITEEFKLDIKWWLKYIVSYNGVSMMLEPRWYAPDEIIETDACLSGCGAVCGEEFFHMEFPQELLNLELQINVLEMITILVAVQLWSNVLKCKKVLVKCDNMVSVNAFNNLNSRNRLLQACVRDILYICGSQDFQIKLVHIPGCENRTSDALSRWHLGSIYRDQFHASVEGRNMYQRNVDPSMFVVKDHWL
jgi:hypothetical protein